MSTVKNPIASEGENVSEIQTITNRVFSLNQATDWWNVAMVWALVLAALSAIAVVGTTVMALKRSKQAGDAQSELIKAKDNQLAIDLKDRDVKIADARQDTARLTKENLTLQSDVLKLREKMADRHLTPEQQGNVALKLRPFAGTRINFFAMGGDSEILALAEEILKVLADPNPSTKWAVTVGAGQDSSIFSSGILVQVAPDADAPTRNAAAALMEALRAERLTVLGPLPPTAGAIMGNVSSDPLAKIRIVIAKKPTEP